MGIPHTEIDLILVNGDAKDFGHQPTSGDRIAAYPGVRGVRHRVDGPAAPGAAA